MIGRPAIKAYIAAKIGGDTVRATRITKSLRNGGTLGVARRLANNPSSRTTGLYGLYPRRNSDLLLYFR